MHWGADKILPLIFLYLGEYMFIISKYVIICFEQLYIPYSVQRRKEYYCLFLHSSHHLVLCLVERIWHYSVRDDGEAQEGWWFEQTCWPFFVHIFISPGTSFLCLKVSGCCRATSKWVGKSDSLITHIHLWRDLKETWPPRSSCKHRSWEIRSVRTQKVVSGIFFFQIEDFLFQTYGPDIWLI